MCRGGLKKDSVNRTNETLSENGAQRNQTDAQVQEAAGAVEDEAKVQEESKEVDVEKPPASGD